MAMSEGFWEDAALFIAGPMPAVVSTCSHLVLNAFHSRERGMADQASLRG